MKKIFVSGLVLFLGLWNAPVSAETPAVSPVAAVPIADAVAVPVTPDVPVQVKTSAKVETPFRVETPVQVQKPTKAERAAQKKARAEGKQQAAAQKKAEKAEKTGKKGADEKDAGVGKPGKQGKRGDAEGSEKPGKPEKGGKGDDEKWKAKGERSNYKSDFSGRELCGNMQTNFKTHPEFKKLVEEEVALETRSRELARQHHAEKNPQKKAKLEAELRTVVERHFVVRQERRLYELKLFEERIAGLRDQINARSEKKDRIVEKRMEELIGTEEDLRF